MAGNALFELAADLKAAGVLSFRWVVEHVPDGDLDAAVQRLWAEETNDHSMRMLLQALGTPLTYLESVCTLGRCRHSCPLCRDAIRAAVLRPPQIPLLPP